RSARASAPPRGRPPNRSRRRSFAGVLMLTAESRQLGRLDIARAINVEHQRQDDAVNLLAPVDQPFEIVAEPGEAGRRPRDPRRRQPIEAGRDVAAVIAAEAEDA